jgi:pSer/pThr/pTyr-binding forkhead associated (FHA) protein
MTSIFRIVLRDVKRYDTYETRQFDLPLNATFPIGRASSNVTKKELMAAPHNAYIDSPVISRQHALLSANSSSGTPEVYISDQGSMHGTMLNGQRLPPKTPTKLKYGDELQFGTDVNRNEEFFVARKYVFESQLSRPFSLGFTVPDAESEDEEVERGGSYADPLLVIEDDLEMAPEQLNQDNQADTTIVMEDVLQQEQPIKRSRFGPDVYPESALDSTAADDAYDEEKEDKDVSRPDFEPYSDDSRLPCTPRSCDLEDDDDFDFDSKAGSSDNSDMDSESESEIQDLEDEVNGAGYSEAVTTSATHEVQYSNNNMASASKQPLGAHPPNMPTRNIFAFGDDCNVLPRLQGVDMFELQRPDTSGNACAESSRAGMTKVAKTEHLPSCDDTAPPLPPRPSSNQASWDSWSYPHFGQNEAQGWNQDVNYQFNSRCYEELFIPAPPPPAPDSTNARSSVSFCQQPTQASQADRLQTPPPAPTSDVEACSPLQPGRRTKVSIEEIVEEVIEEHPPTPESVNYKKRKADTLDEEALVAEEGMPQQAAIAVEQESSGPTNADSVLETVATQAAVQIAQRPKKTPRSVLNKVLNKAAYPLLGATGAVVSFALLSTLPDNFFM